MKVNPRDFFWLTLLIAMGLAWWLDHRRHEWRESNAKNRIQRMFRPRDTEEWFLQNRIPWDEEQDQIDADPFWSPGRRESEWRI